MSSLIPPGASSGRIWRPFTRSKGLNNVAEHKGQVSSAGRHSWHFYEKGRVVARFSSQKMGSLSLSVSPRFINPFFVVALLTPREKTTCPAKTYLDDVLISFTAVCRSFRETVRDHLFLPRRVKETCRRQFETRR